MRDFSKYQGVIPAFYACYDDLGAVSATKVRELTRYLIGKGVKGLYVGGSSGECIYQSVQAGPGECDGRGQRQGHHHRPRGLQQHL